MIQDLTTVSSSQERLRVALKRRLAGAYERGAGVGADGGKLHVSLLLLLHRLVKQAQRWEVGRRANTLQAQNSLFSFLRPAAFSSGGPPGERSSAGRKRKREAVREEE